MLPSRFLQALRAHLDTIQRQHTADLAAGSAPSPSPTPSQQNTPLPLANGDGNGSSPPPARYRDRLTGHVRRHHLHDTVIQRAVRTAALRANVIKPITPHTFRQTFTTHVLEDDGYDIRTIPELRGHQDV